MSKVIEMPAPVEQIISQLNVHGYQAYAVGGCVRDSLLGRTPEDWDITTSARPEEVKAVFRRTVDTGIAHGTVTVMVGKTGYEVTTYRIDGKYEDGRHPKQVTFTPSLEEDLKRRDFTINAMAYSQKEGIVDIFGGVKDLEAGVIRCVGSPIERFTEDALRILRAVRFSAQLGFEIEANTYKAIGEIAPNLGRVSKERILAELTKLLLSDHPERITAVYEAGMAPYISPRFAAVAKPLPHISPILPKRKHLRWAAFLQNEPEDAAAGVLKELKSDNDTINRVRILTRWCKMKIIPDKAAVRRIMSRMTPELYDDLILLKESILAEGPEREQLKQVKRLTAEIRESGDCLYLRDLALNGRDLMEAGVAPGKAVGDTLERLLEQVLEEPEKNTREALLEMLRTG